MADRRVTTPSASSTPREGGPSASPPKSSPRGLPRASVATLAELRAWLARHRVHGLNLSNPAKPRIEAIAHGSDVWSVLEVARELLQAIDAELVWMHDRERKLLPPRTLFALRSSLKAPVRRRQASA